MLCKLKHKKNGNKNVYNSKNRENVKITVNIFIFKFALNGREIVVKNNYLLIKVFL